LGLLKSYKLAVKLGNISPLSLPWLPQGDSAVLQVEIRMVVVVPRGELSRSVSSVNTLFI